MVLKILALLHAKPLQVLLLKSYQLKSVSCCWLQLGFLSTLMWFVEVILKNLYLPKKTGNGVELICRELIPCKTFARRIGWQGVYRQQREKINSSGRREWST